MDSLLPKTLLEEYKYVPIPKILNDDYILPENRNGVRYKKKNIQKID